MKKRILSLGKALSKNEQKVINGGFAGRCKDPGDCSPAETCVGGYCVPPF